MSAEQCRTKNGMFRDFYKRIIVYVETLLPYQDSKPPRVSFVMAFIAMFYKDICKLNIQHNRIKYPSEKSRIGYFVLVFKMFFLIEV